MKEKLSKEEIIQKIWASGNISLPIFFCFYLGLNVHINTVFHFLNTFQWSNAYEDPRIVSGT